jgi:hypothetical protein
MGPGLAAEVTGMASVTVASFNMARSLPETRVHGVGIDSRACTLIPVDTIHWSTGVKRRGDGHR